jgi:TetR/AcrR family transcriptional regulator
MSITDRRRREKQQRHDDIVDAAERVFFRKGWEEATMEDVAAEAELAKATLYLYFKSKEDLYAAVLLRGFQIMHGMFERGVAGAASGIDRVEAVGRAYIEFARAYPDYFGAMIHFSAKAPSEEDATPSVRECDELGERTIMLVASAVQSGIDDGTVRAELDPLRTAFILWAQTTGMLQILSLKGEHIEGVHGVSSDDLMERFFRFVELALRPGATGEGGEAR